MKYVLPRVISGNRGDLASRWGVLSALYEIGEKDVSVFCANRQDVPPLPYGYLPYRPFRNLLQDRIGRNALRGADVVLWAVGLDLQDDSSLAKLFYLWVIFSLYRRMGLKIWLAFQGAGPLNTRIGRMLAGTILEKVDLFVARDPGTYNLIGEVRPSTRLVLAHDGIFLPGFENYSRAIGAHDEEWLSRLFSRRGRPVIGLNVRHWFHFSHRLLPYQFAQKIYLQRSAAKMTELVAAYTNWVEILRKQLDARILLISAYQPGEVPWEDDLPWLEGIKQHFSQDLDVVLVDSPVSLSTYYAMMSGLDLMIGMRLHSSLIALRMGVPAMNVSYTLKGRDIMRYLGLGDNVVDLNDAIMDPHRVLDRAISILSSPQLEKQRVGQSVQQAIETNLQVMRSLR
jgi:polysaccharide pyruvyl transferase WcaK-like protein